jgi:hypothetical protein
MKKPALFSFIIMMGISLPLHNDTWKKFIYRGPALYNGADLETKNIVEEKSEEQIKREEMEKLTIEELRERRDIQESFLKELGVDTPKQSYNDCTKEELIELIVENAKLIELKSQPLLEKTKKDIKISEEKKEETKEEIKEEIKEESKEETKEEDRYSKLEEEIKNLKESNKNLQDKLCRKETSKPLDMNMGFMMLQSQINNIQLMQQNMLMLQMFNMRFNHGSDYIYNPNLYTQSSIDPVKAMFMELGQRTPSVYDYLGQFNNNPMNFDQKNIMMLNTQVAPANELLKDPFQEQINSIEYYSNPYYFDQMYF